MITRDTALRGVFPIAPTPFTPTGELDLEGQRRVLKDPAPVSRLMQFGDHGI